jgi:hypothetical protein
VVGVADELREASAVGVADVEGERVGVGGRHGRQSSQRVEPPAANRGRRCASPCGVRVACQARPRT